MGAHESVVAMMNKGGDESKRIRNEEVEMEQG